MKISNQWIATAQNTEILIYDWLGKQPDLDQLEYQYPLVRLTYKELT